MSRCLWAWGYRYGFNGKENDNEVKGEGNQQDYGMRVYDPRIGKFLSVDPITNKYPELTPYQFASNRPIEGVDIDGMEVGYWDKNLNYYSMPSDAIRHPIPKGTSLPSIRALEGGKAQSIMMSPSYMIAGTALTIVATPYIAAAIGTSGSWAMGAGLTIASNPQAIQATAEFASGMIYDGPGDLFPGSGFDNAGKTAGEGIQKVPRIVSNLFLSKRKALNSGSILHSYGKALQSLTREALEASEKVYNGATVYRLGTKGISKTGAEAEFWSFENPLAMGVEEYAKKYGIKLENVKNADFIETATLKPGAKYVTREAPTMPGAPANTGGGIEAVIEKGGTIGNVITPIKR